MRDECVGDNFNLNPIVKPPDFVLNIVEDDLYSGYHTIRGQI